MSLTTRQQDELRASTVVVEHISVEIRADDGTYVDFNADFDYWTDGSSYLGGLEAPPRLSISEDVGGQIVAVDLSDIAMSNRLWKNGAGLFDQPFPVTVNGKVFASFVGKQLRIRINYRIGGEEVGAVTLPITYDGFVIEDLVAGFETATLVLSGPSKKFADQPMDLLRDGDGNFEAVRLPFLFRRIFGLVGVPTTGIPAVFDLQDFTEPLAQSLGPCPGLNTSGLPFGEKWIPRGLCIDADDPDVLWVGMECPGAQAISGGAIYKYNILSGLWEKGSVGPLSGIFAYGEGYPVGLLHLPGEFYLQAFAYKPTGSDDTLGSRQEFATLYRAKFNRTGLSHGGNFSNRFAYWPTMGMHVQGGLRINADAIFGCLERMAGTAATWLSEPMAIPFPQVFEGLGDLWYGVATFPWVTPATLNWPHDPIIARDAFWHGHSLGDAASDYLGNVISNQDQGIEPTNELAPVGCYSGLVRVSSTGGAQWESAGGTFDGLGWKCYHNDRLAEPVHFRQTDEKDVWVILATPSGTLQWHSYLFRDQDSANVWRDHTIWSESAGFWRKQITAYCPDAYTGSTSSLNLLVASWNVPAYTGSGDVSSTTEPSTLRTSAALYRVNLSINSTANTPTLIWSETYDGTTDGRALEIVDLWTVAPNSADGRYSAAYVVAVFLDKNKVGGGSYTLGLGYYNGAAWVWIDWIGSSSYVGPISSSPFAGFVLISGTGANGVNQFLFVDQATGQIWKCTTAAHNGAPTYQVVNQGRPLHAVETWLSYKRGVVTTSSDGYQRVYWTTAPTPHHDVFGHWEREDYSAAQRRFRPGSYALVQFSTRNEDVIENADTSGLNGLELCRMLLQLIPDYYLDFGGPLRANGYPVIAKRPTTASTKLVTRSTDVYGQGDQVPIELSSNPKRSTNRKLIYNTVDAVPWALQPQGDPTIQVIRAPGSAFAGDFLYDVRTRREVNLRLSCVAGGDPTKGNFDAADFLSSALIWRWTQLRESVVVYLSGLLTGFETSINVVGLRKEGTSSYYAGDTQVRPGDTLQIDGGTLLTIQSIFMSDGEYRAVLGLSAATGISTASPLAVTIFPNVTGTASDDPATAMVLFSAMVARTAGAVETVKVSEPWRVERHMVFRIGREWMALARSGRDAANGLRVIRGMFGSPAEAHASGSRVLLYLRTMETKRLYPISNTGVYFGVSVDGVTQVDQRALSPGDSVIIRAPGSHLAPVQNASIRAVNRASIDRYGQRSLPLKDNRFLDFAKLDRISQAWLNEYADPRYEIRGLRSRWFRDFRIASAYYIDDPRLAPEEGVFQIIGLTIDFATLEHQFDVRGTYGVVGATPAPSPAGFAVRGGARRRS